MGDNSGNHDRIYLDKLLHWEAAAKKVREIQADGGKVVFTNGAFDILHPGHVDYMTFARDQGDCLIVGLNSDASVKRYKDSRRPILPERERAKMLLALKCVDYVVIFEQDEPRELIEKLVPDVLVKGADWAHYVSGRECVEANGGQVILAEMTPGNSTSNIVQTILDRYTQS